MKKTIFWASLFVLTSLGSFAQELHKNDPGYSPHNYKHPNKAKAAQKQVKALPVLSSSDIVRNYKQPNLSKERALTIERSQPKEIYLSRKSYKMPYNTNQELERLASTDTDTTKNNVLD